MLLQATTLILAAGAFATPLDLVERQGSCPPVHIFGARETTVSPGYGTAGVVVNLVLNFNAGSTAEAIVYPACGGQASCGGQSYAQSALAGTAAVASAVNSFNTRCPNTKLVLVGYSQGGQIMDNAVCGGGDTNIGLSNTAVPIQASAVNMIKAVIEMGSPRFRAGFPYNIGTCTAQGFAPRPAGFVCPSGSKLKSYCDAADPYCCTGSDQATHQGYGSKYGQQALAFINTQLAAGGINPTTTAGGSQPTTTARTTTAGGSNPTTSASGGSGDVSPKWGQCGGQGWTGPNSCAVGSTCKYSNAWYSQCL